MLTKPLYPRHTGRYSSTDSE